MPDDRPGQASEGRLVARHFLGIAALQTLGRELDRRQRVLDLMRNPTSHIGPGGAPLIGQLLRDVVERQDMARCVFGYFDCQGPYFAMRARLNDSRPLLRSDKGRKFWRNGAQRSPYRIIAVLHQNGGGRTVEKQDHPFPVHRQYARGYA